MARRPVTLRAAAELALALAALIVADAAVTRAQVLEEARAASLANLVRQDCGSCHGLTMKGGLGRPLLPENLKHADAEGLAYIILNGVPGTPMPPWRGLLSEKEARWIAEQLKKGLPP